MDMKAAFRETLELAEERGMREKNFLDPSLDLYHLEDMYETIETESIMGNKLGRWLGWAQAAVVAAGCATLDEMKDINVKHSGKPKLGLDPKPWVHACLDLNCPYRKQRRATQEVIADAWLPEDGYEQNRANYPEGVR